jgi:excisionase family DNA binding protein
LLLDSPTKEPDMPIRTLTDADAYIPVADLATYWAVSRHHIRKLIEAGALEAIRLGPRLYRVPRQAALDFEAKTETAARDEHVDVARPASQTPPQPLKVLVPNDVPQRNRVA